MGGTPHALEVVWVIRAEVGERPRFRSIATGSPLPIRVERIAEKLQNRYRCQEPLELLAYCHIGGACTRHGPGRNCECGEPVSCRLAVSAGLGLWGLAETGRATIPNAN